jgi:hypothetical protein
VGPATLVRIGIYYAYVGLLAACGLAAFLAAAINAVAGRWINIDAFLYLAVVLPVAAAGMCRGVVATRRREARDRQLRRDHPGEPWRWRSDWADGCVVFSEQDATREKWGALGGVALATTPVIIAARLAGDTMERGPRLFLIASLAGLNLWLLQFVWRSWRLSARTGAPVLRLSSVPLVPGFPLLATVCPQYPVAEPDALVLSLRCISRYTSSNARRSDSLRWSRDIALPAWTGTDITINLDVPADRPATSNRDSSTAIVWELHVAGGPARAPIRWVFPLPVFVP